MKRALTFNDSGDIRMISFKLKWVALITQALRRLVKRDISQIPFMSKQDVGL